MANISKTDQGGTKLVMKTIRKPYARNLTVPLLTLSHWAGHLPKF